MISRARREMRRAIVHGTSLMPKRVESSVKWLLKNCKKRNRQGERAPRAAGGAQACTQSMKMYDCVICPPKYGPVYANKPNSH